MNFVLLQASDAGNNDGEHLSTPLPSVEVKMHMCFFFCSILASTNVRGILGISICENRTDTKAFEFEDRIS